MVKEIAGGVKALIERDGKALVLCKPNGELDLPGGRLEAGETREEALLREVLEETGLKVMLLGLLATWSFIKPDGLEVHGVTYHCRYLSGDVTLSSEHSDYSWYERDEADRLLHQRWFGSVIAA